MTNFEHPGDLTTEQVVAINQEMAAKEPDLDSALWLIEWAKDQFGDKVFADTSFGKDSALMWDVVALAADDIAFTFGDTKLMPPQTYALKKQLTEEYPMKLQEAIPNDEDLAKVIEKKLWRSTKRRDLDRFLDVVKLEPLRKLDLMLGKRATLAAARFDQTLDREGLDYVVQQHDGTFRVYPFLKWPEQQVDEYIDGNGLPRNRLPALYGMGAVSYRNIVYYDGAIEIVDFDSCGRNSPDNMPVHGQA